MIFFFFLIASIGIITLSLYFLDGVSSSVRKMKILRTYSSLLSDMNIDYRSTGIAPTSILEIRRSLIAFTREIESMNRSIHDHSPHDQKWLLDMIVEFRRELTLWMARHETELGIEIDRVAQVESETLSPSSSAALDLATERLTLQIAGLERVRTS